VIARFLLDTTWIIDHFNGWQLITRRLEQLRPSGLALSVISLTELSEGVHDARDPETSRRVLSRFVSGLTVVAVDDEIGDIFGRERGRLREGDAATDTTRVQSVLLYNRLQVTPAPAVATFSDVPTASTPRRSAA
jgi:predicted nucleic acid-binding protein